MQSDAKYHLFNKLIINYKRGVAGNIVRKPGYIIGCSIMKQNFRK